MRRWQLFGVDPNTLQIWQYAPGDWLTSYPVYISFPKKHETLLNLQKMYGNGTPHEAIYVQQCFLDDLYVAPAADCAANHLPPGYSMIGGMSALGNFLTNGFYDRNFVTLPPIFRIRLHDDIVVNDP